MFGKPVFEQAVRELVEELGQVPEAYELRRYIKEQQEDRTSTVDLEERIEEGGRAGVRRKDQSL